MAINRKHTKVGHTTYLKDNNNNRPNNNNQDNVYGAVVMAELLREFTRFITTTPNYSIDPRHLCLLNYKTRLPVQFLMTR